MSNEAINTINDDLPYDPDADEVTNEEIVTDKPEANKETVDKSTEEITDEQQEGNKETTSQPSKTVPYQRFQQKVHEANELSQKYRELELELARLQGAASAQTKQRAEPPKEPELNIKQLRRDYYEAMAIGDDDKALEIQEQIDTYHDKLTEEKALKIAEKVIKEREEAKQQEQEQLTQAENKKYADEFLEKYDYLNDESANFDPDAFEVFSAFFKSTIESGTKTFKESLDYAVSKVEILTNRQTTQPVQKKPTLTKEQVEEQLARANKATPQISKKGTSGKDIIVDPADMSEEEYERFRDNGGRFDFES
ncbi:hypothetical protein [Entomomonas asaccharolytica]|uniref:Uncharacterized protein n=1 Tax=Entomomonas asaccharolytica TaxID=2785331 RepID=A0A974NE06_9GAMM|nr:hypothetical protein [Entomomonas asaccharolytica]QQP85020.1 hypothetical protein JHT90_11565 [Entomomonas asaccharolytica]